MRILLWFIVFVLITADTFSLELGLAPGLSAKNALLYLAAVFLAGRFIITRTFKVQLGGVHAAFLILVTYAVITLFVAAYGIAYPRYKFLESAMFLKGNLVDHYLFFAVFFFGPRTRDEALSVIKALIVAACAANFITVVDASGLIHLGVTEVGEDGRVQGAMGEQNQYGAYIIAFLPAMLAYAISGRGAMRAVWLLAAMISLAALLMTASRGAMVGLIFSAVWGAYLFRRYLSPEKVIIWGLSAFVLISVVVAMLSLQFGDLLKEHVLQGTFTNNATEASSGRTELWGPAFSLLMSHPWALITGFCWDAYAHLLTSVTHNHYLDLWFNLGLIGLFAFLFILIRVCIFARSTCEIATPAVRAQLMAFVFGLIAVAGAIFFVNLYSPWPYIWAYVGATMRLAIEERSAGAAGQSSAIRQAREATPAAGVRRGGVRKPSPALSSGRGQF